VTLRDLWVSALIAAEIGVLIWIFAYLVSL
jgi:hypothetical protein